jgi:eukaryotic-like serine/threonine-protein kinase
MAKSPSKAPSRYEIKEVIGEGGMGLVYRAVDQAMRREVTLKTIRDAQDPAILELFRRECDVLGSLAHPNIVEIFDIGEIDVDGARRPYFVMPYLRGVTLDKLIQAASPRLAVERSVQMIGSVCRGLQAAHDQGLVHRDLKPGNIFVLEDDSIKIIDFGVAHLVDQRSVTGLKGTLLYMAPEQLQLKKPTAVSDQFSLAVITYEMMTLRHPFHVPGLEDLASAILNHAPPPASDINPLIPTAVSQVIHKALAKEPFHRFANVREFADCLQKASRNEPIEFFDPNRVEPRVAKVQKAIADGDWDFAAEIVRELKSESYLNPEIDRLDREIADSVRSRSVKQLLDTARRRFEENEHILALQKVQEVLDLDSSNIDALALREKISSHRTSAKVEDWLRLAQQHLDNRAYSHAREALTKLLDERSNDTRARTLLAEVDRQEANSARVRQEKQRAYDSALEAFKRGDVNSAVSKLEHGLEADRLSPSGSSSEQATAYQKLYEEVRSKRDQLISLQDEVKRHISERRFEAAFKVCSTVLAEYPDNVAFNFFRDEAEQGLRQETSAFVANVEKEVAEEPDLNRKVAILENALAKYPSEQRFDHALKLVRSRKDQVDSIVTRAQSLESAGNFQDALAQWETLANIHPQYPGLKVEIDRVQKRRQQQTRQGAKANWISQIDQAVNVHNYSRASVLLKEAFSEFPGDGELATLEQTIAQLSNRQTDAEQHLARAAELEAQGNPAEALNTLRSAFQMVPHMQAVRNALLDLLLKQAGNLLDSNFAEAEPLVEEAATIEPKNALARSLRTLINDKKQAEEVAQVLARARLLQGQGKNREAIKEVDTSLLRFPRENRLIQLRATLGVSLSPQERDELRTQDLQEIRRLEAESSKTTDSGNLDTIFQRTQLFKTKYADDRDFSSSIATIEKRVTDIGQRKVAVSPVKIPGAGSKDPGAANDKNKRASAPNPAPAPGIKPGRDEWVKTPAPGVAKPAAGSNSGGGAKWTSSRGAQIGFAAGGALLAGLLLYLGMTFTSGKKADSATPLASLITVNVPAPQAPFTIVDGAGKDVTSAAAFGGLAPGEYHLKAARPGFRGVDQSFTLSAGEKTREIPIIWQSLPARVMVQAFKGASVSSGATIFAPGPGNTWTAELPDGTHTIQATFNNNTVSTDITISNGEATVANWNLGAGRAFVAVSSPTALKYEALGFGSKIRSGNQTVDSAGELAALAPGESVSFVSATGARTDLSQAGAVDPAAHSAAVFLSFFHATRGSGRPSGNAGSAAAEANTSSPSGNTQASPQQVQQPPESPADRRRRELQEELDRLANEGKKKQ